MSPEKSSTAPLRGLFTAFKRMILPTAEAELPLIRHAELGTAEDEAAWRSEFDHLRDLATSIYDELIDGAFLWELPKTVGSCIIWEALDDWPTDEAGILLHEWRMAA